jgi:arsenic resistance protein ArsH
MPPHSVQPNVTASSCQHQPQYNITESTSAQGDLNNVASMRQTDEIHGNPAFAYRSLAIPAEDDEVDIRDDYRPFLLDSAVAEQDWIAKLELATVTEMAHRDLIKTGSRLKVLVLYGSLRQRYISDSAWPPFSQRRTLTPYSSYSKLLAFEISRILWRLGCDVRVFDPASLPMKDDVQHTHPKVQELRDLSRWSDGHFWVSPEQHGNLVGNPALIIVPPCSSRSLLTNEPGPHS